MDYNNNNHNNGNDNNGRYRDNHDTAKKSGVGIGAIVVIALIAIAAWFMFNNGRDDTPNVDVDTHGAVGAIERGAERLGEKVKDGAAEVPQAADDATTPGDQKTTRPNDPDSTEKLDQK